MSRIGAESESEPEAAGAKQKQFWSDMLESAGTQEAKTVRIQQHYVTAMTGPAVTLVTRVMYPIYQSGNIRATLC